MPWGEARHLITRKDRCSMKKTTLLIALFALFAGAATAKAQVYVRPVCCPAAYGDQYATSYAPSYAPTYSVAQQPVHAAGTTTCCRGNVRAYYAGNCCGGSLVQGCSNCCYAASPCAGRAACRPAIAYQPVAAYGPQPSGCRPYIRRGLLGQPTIYVPGQPLRNFFRFFSL